MRNFPLSRAWPIVGLGLILGACAPVIGINPRVPPAGSPALQEGYLDGCSSGFKDAGRDGFEGAYRKNDTRYTAEADYRQGWDRGDLACFDEEKRHPKMHGEGGTGGRGR